MSDTVSRKAAALAVTIATLVAGAQTSVSAASRLDIAFAQTPYAVASACDPTQPLASLNVLLRNTGDAPTTQQSVNATDAAGGLAGSLSLAPIPAGAAIAVGIPLRRAASSTAPIGGTHAVTVSVGAQRLGPLTVTIPLSLCADSGTVMQKQRARVPLAALATASPTPSARFDQNARAVPGQAATNALARVQLSLPVPSDLHYTTNETTCRAHGGDAISCETLRTHHAVAIYWTSAVPACATCAIKGFRLRAGANPASALLDVSASPFAVEQPPAAGWSGQCFVITSYHEPVTQMVNDGTGRKIPLPGATPSGVRGESAPSAALCIAATQRDIVIAPSLIRSYRRTYWINYRTDSTEHVKDDPPTSSTLQIGNEYIKNKEDSQVNIFNRTAVAFDRSSIGAATVFGGAFAFNVTRARTGQCLYVSSPVQNGWESATWVAATGTTLPDATRSGATYSTPIDAALRSWSPGRSATYLMGGEAAEFVKSGIEEHNYSCYGDVSNIRLIVSVGVDR